MLWESFVEKRPKFDFGRFVRFWWFSHACFHCSSNSTRNSGNWTSFIIKVIEIFVKLTMFWWIGSRIDDLRFIFEKRDLYPLNHHLWTINPGDQFREVCDSSCLFDMVLSVARRSVLWFMLIGCVACRGDQTRSVWFFMHCLIWCSTRWSGRRSVMWFMFVECVARQGDQLRELCSDSCLLDVVHVEVIRREVCDSSCIVWYGARQGDQEGEVWCDSCVW